MRKLFLLLVLTLGLSGFAQTVTEKYNSLMSRYEYYSSTGKIIGYKTYDSLMKTWNYYDVSQQGESKIENTYVDPIDINLVDKALSAKQSRYDYNVQRVQTAINEINNSVYNSSYSDYVINESISDFNEKCLSVLNTKKYDYSSNSTTIEVINWLQSSMKSFVSGNLRDEEFAVMKQDKLKKESTNNSNTNSTYYFNKGLENMQTAPSKAEEYFEKTINLNPAFSQAYYNLGLIKLSGETEIVNELNKLGVSANNNNRYDELQAKRQDIYMMSLPYFEKAYDLENFNKTYKDMLRSICIGLGLPDKTQLVNEADKVKYEGLKRLFTFYGGYTTNYVTEEIYSTNKPNRYDIISEDKAISKFFIKNGVLHFLRNKNSRWLSSRWDLVSVNQDFYTLSDDYNQLITISRDFKSVIFYADKTQNYYSKRYVYHNLKKDATVKPY